MPEVRPEILSSELESLIKRFKETAKTYDYGRIIRNGINTVIVGKPNVGKSTLMNYLSGFERSIVTDIEGTTRDVIEESVRIGSLTLRLSDTAGIRKTDDVIESMGVDIAFRRAEEADLILAVFDGGREISGEDKEIIKRIVGKNAVAIINKTDKEIIIDKSYLERNFKFIVEISAKNESGMDKLENCLEKSLENVIEAKEALDEGVLLDGITVLLDSAAEKLMELTGEKASEAVVDDVFSRFCVGK